ncbi:MAG: hypothetical protein K6357_02440 [Elusimicrobiota bacterium]
MKYATLFYSGGKDSHYLLFDILKKGYKVPFLINFEPVPHSDGFKYFNVVYNKKIIEKHSLLMKIPVFYYKFGGKNGKIFKDDRGVFIENILQFLSQKKDKLELKSNIKLFVPWILNDLIDSQKAFKRYNIIKDILIKKNISFEFSIIKETSFSIIKKSIENGIKSVCYSLPKPHLKKGKGIEEYIKKMVGREIDLNFYRELLYLKNKISEIGSVFPIADLHSIVFSSPLFEKDICLKNSKVLEDENSFFLNLS